jgi:K+-sensing histidine kinase KdpD
MGELIQDLWDQMRADLGAKALPQLDQANHALLSGSLGPLTLSQVEDLESVKRSLTRLNQRMAGEPIDWTNYGAAAHALRGPLNSAIGFSRLILKEIDGPINAAQRAALETIHTISRQLLVYFNLLLDAMLLNRDSISFTSEQVQPDEILSELAASAQALAENRGFRFETFVSPSVADVTVQCDAKLLKKALSALLAVSSNYVDEGSVVLRADVSNDALVIDFQNQESQLSLSLLADLPRLLRDETDRSFPYDAHLHLGVAWRLVAAMGGDLKAEHAENTCAFLVTLPIG